MMPSTNLMPNKSLRLIDTAVKTLNEMPRTWAHKSHNDASSDGTMMSGSIKPCLHTTLIVDILSNLTSRIGSKRNLHILCVQFVITLLYVISTSEKSFKSCLSTWSYAFLFSLCTSIRDYLHRMDDKIVSEQNENKKA